MLPKEQGDTDCSFNIWIVSVLAQDKRVVSEVEL